ncbi:enoyl-CoA hydratase/isomerase family protein [Rhodococcus rhodochrous]|uniref:enoyl-CoA hydratase/isomerase family protein n=1 Tax=Rhodococcus rhodochrous TaxID=1829 RepID=UPI00036A58CB|nr:enoyl-CoA hydratase/isomerase family protein [Rhodococcus rhodochrous]
MTLELVVETELDSAHVGTVTFERGPHNYFNADLLTALTDAFDDLSARGARAIVLYGAGRHFCAGADFAGNDTAAPGAASSPIYEVVPRLFERTVPVVAATRGASIGGGLGLALAADFRVATAKSRFAANFSRLGFSQGFALSVTLPRLIGLQRTSDLLYTGRTVYGDEALQMGLCDRLVDDEKLLDEARSYASEIAAAAPLAVAAIRQRLHGDLADAVREALQRDWKDQTSLKLTADFREGIAAARERRVPRFVGE